MSDFTDARQALSDALADALGMDFVAGKIDGPLRDTTIGCTWPEGYVPYAQDETYMVAQIKARAIYAVNPNVTETEPDDPGTLEDAIVVGLAAIAASALGGSLVPWFVGSPTVEVDVDANTIDFLVQIQVANPFLAG